MKYDGNALAAPFSDPASLPSLLKAPAAANLIRVFRLQERLKSLGKEGDFHALHVHVVGGGTMGGDIAAWCALRGFDVTLQDREMQDIQPAMDRAAGDMGRSWRSHSTAASNCRSQVMEVFPSSHRDGSIDNRGTSSKAAPGPSLG